MNDPYEICLKGGRYRKATGIVRRVDDLGRIVIPKEIRRTLRVREGEKTVHSLPIVIGKTVFTVLHLSETDYHAAVTADAAYDEDGRGVLKLRLSFPEISGSRHIKIFFEDDSLEVEMKEMPGVGLMRYAVAGIEELLRSKKRMADVVSRLDPDLLFFKLERSMEPRFRLRAKNDHTPRS